MQGGRRTPSYTNLVSANKHLQPAEVPRLLRHPAHMGNLLSNPRWHSREGRQVQPSGGLGVEAPAMGWQVEEQKRDTTRVRQQGDPVRVELSDVFDVAVDTPEVALHDSWNDEEMQGIER